LTEVIQNKEMIRIRLRQKDKRKEMRDQKVFCKLIQLERSMSAGAIAFGYMKCIIKILDYNADLRTSEGTVSIGEDRQV
jgi:hypothetical protein